MNSNQSLSTLFYTQQQNADEVKKTTASERKGKLIKLKTAIVSMEMEILKALHNDLRKSEFEATYSELIPVYSEIKFALKNLENWMKPKKVSSEIQNILAKNRLYYEPKGVCLIISPWNYPFQLLIAPLVSAIAAGNCCILKPSEISSHTSAVLKKLIDNVFNDDEVALIEGDSTVATELLKLPFDHIFYTGSTAIGKVVMEAAAKNLSSVTLELGGKSPAIITNDVEIKKVAEKIMWAKFLNAGQTCIAPDYVLIHESVEKEFISACKISLENQLPDLKKINYDVTDYPKIISKKHFERIKNLMESAIIEGAKSELPLFFDEKNLTIFPVILSSLDNKSKVMEEEIFGPVLPIITFKTLKEASIQIKNKPKALAMYIFSNSEKDVDFLISSTTAGGTVINDLLIQFAEVNLPFGGVNHSGIGSSHGYFGFKTFSHERAVIFQSKINFTSQIFPPYKGKEKILKLMKRFM